MQFQVPQFIDIEDKIIGPLTLKQFLYLAGAAGFSFILFFAVEQWLWIALTAILGILATTFAFIKYNGQPMPKVLLSAAKYLWLPKFYLWRHQAVNVAKPLTISTPKNTEPQKNPLATLWFKMNTLGGIIPNREKQLPKTSMLGISPSARQEAIFRSHAV